MVIRFLALALLFTGCASQLQTLTPSTSFLTSETQGEFGELSVAAGIVDGAIAYADLDEESTAVKFKGGKSLTHIMVMPQLGLAKRVDVFIKATTHTPFLYGLKLQLFGHTKAEAKNGTESFSLYMGGGRKRYSAPSEANFSGGGDYTADRDNTMVEMGAVYGRRIYSDILLYGRYSRISQSSNGDIKFEQNPTIDGDRFELAGLHNSFGLGIVWYTKNVNAGFELTTLKTNWDNAPNERTYSLLLALSKDFSL